MDGSLIPTDDMPQRLGPAVKIASFVVLFFAPETINITPN